MVSWPGENASNPYTKAIVLIYGGLIARTEPLKFDKYDGLEALKVYFQEYRMDPIVWQYVTTSQYGAFLGIAKVKPRFAHSAVAMSNVQNLSRAMIIFGGEYLDTSS